VIKNKMKGKDDNGVVSQWIKSESVEGMKCPASTEEDFLKPENLLQMFEFRTNLLL
jgi:hypothetical protein